MRRHVRGVVTCSQEYSPLYAPPGFPASIQRNLGRECWCWVRWLELLDGLAGAWVMLGESTDKKVNADDSLAAMGKVNSISLAAQPQARSPPWGTSLGCLQARRACCLAGRPRCLHIADRHVAIRVPSTWSPPLSVFHCHQRRFYNTEFRTPMRSRDHLPEQRQLVDIYD